MDFLYRWADGKLYDRSVIGRIPEASPSTRNAFGGIKGSISLNLRLRDKK